MTSHLLAAFERTTPLIAWTLAHFLWQGAVIAGGLALLLRLTTSPRLRHALALAALGLMAAAPLVTFALLKDGVQIALAPLGWPGAEPPHVWQSIAVVLWMAGVAALGVRTAGGLLVVEQLRRSAQALPGDWPQRCRRLKARMGGALNVVFAQSEAVATPILAGWLKPMVLIPASAFARMAPETLEALILHELAHVRRLDALANLLQGVVETLLFFHPAVWWVSRRIRIEREFCCDDLVVDALGDRALYARALQLAADFGASPRGVLAANDGDLAHRIARVLGISRRPAPPPIARAAGVLMTGLAAVLLAQGERVQAEPAAAPAPQVRAVAASRVPTPDAAPVEQSSAPAVMVLASSAVARPDAAVATAQPEFAAPASAVIAPMAAPALIQQPTPAPMVYAAQTLAPVVVTRPTRPMIADAIVKVGEDKQAVTIWPAKALLRGADGKVRLACRVDVHGLAERCRPLSEEPQGLGFGDAAQAMTSSLVLAEGTGDERIIEFDFKAAETFSNAGPAISACAGAPLGGTACATSGRSGPGNAGSNNGPLHRMTMMDHPVWNRAPSFEDLSRAYPRGRSETAVVILHCEVMTDGALNRCIASKEFPFHKGFGEAAVKLAAKFQVSDESLRRAPTKDPLEVDIPITFEPPQSAGAHQVNAPQWLTDFDPRKAPKLFPPEAASAGQTTGRGVAVCEVGGDGRLAGCSADAADSDSADFSKAAALVASTLRMNLWSEDGAPVEGATVHVPVRFNLARGG